MKRNEYGEILASEFEREIELADNIYEIVNLREILDNDEVEECLRMSTMLSAKENDWELGLL